MTTMSIGSWHELQLKDLFLAFRKAKADCFFERSICISEKFADYESDVPAKLVLLLSRLSSGEVSQVFAENLGSPCLVAKKLSIKPKPLVKGAVPDGHGFFSDPSRAFARLCDTHTLTPEFRLVGDFPVDMHVLSALWINLVGHKFDEVLSNSAYGSRLRRYRAEPGSPKGSTGNYHTEAIGSFQPYFAPYRQWRARGLNAIRSELQAERPVIAISMDLTSYYHRIDPSFMADKRFLKEAGIELSPWELEFTSAFATALVAWSTIVAKKMGKMGKMGCKAKDTKVGGLPIGLSISRVVANALLVGLDSDIEQGLAPVYYGRYVDDLFLVLRDPGNLVDATQLLQFISARTHCFPANAEGTDNDEIYLNLPGGFLDKKALLLQQTKQKAFFLQGQGGLDLLDNIETQIRSVSSERRLMPSPGRLESMASAKVLTAAGHPSEDADTLRRADGLAVRRLGWSIQLRAVETLARDLHQDDWRIERKKFYQFAHSHILRPDKILDHHDYLPRLLSLAVALMDWSEARRLLDTTLTAITTLQMQENSKQIKVNGFPAKSEYAGTWIELRETTLALAADAICRALRWSQRGGDIRPLSETAISVCKLVGLGSDPDLIRKKSIALRESDWAKTSYKDHLRRDATRQRPPVKNESALYGIYSHEADLKEFLHLTAETVNGSGAVRINPRCDKDTSASLLPYLFPTRAYSTQEISLFLPEHCVFNDVDTRPVRTWARYVRAVRGVWVWDSLVANIEANSLPTSTDDQKDAGRIAHLGTMKSGAKVRLGISSLLTTDESFFATANGRSDISPSRYERIERLINLAISAKPRPTHLLLPELSLPERWIDTVSSLLRDAGISLIAGLDYHRESPNLIHSEAVLVLTDDRLGFPASVQIRQQKSMPAAGEEETLLKTFGQIWPKKLATVKKPVYVHDGFCFGVLVCSELQNVKHRLRFQGDVDCMMVLSWNQDLETFVALVESASLDVHAHVALVNNRKFGDSRVRTPAKQQHDRDLCRLRGGENEHVVVVELDIQGLRAFQSRATRWPSKGDPYKPTPEGYKIAKFRHTVPS